MPDPFDTIAQLGIVPVVAVERAEHAVPLADALIAGGLPVAEITFRTPAAGKVIATLARERPQLLTGAGTVLDVASLETAQRSGARFALAPGFDPEIVDTARALGLPFAPGVMTPSELTAAVRRGVRLAKFFPAAAAGGPAALDAIAAPFSHLGVRFIPTGGVTPETVTDWLRLRAVAAVGGTWIARADDLAEGRFAAIAAKARDAVERARAARG